MKTVVIDIETTLDHKTIHCVSVRDIVTGETNTFRTRGDFFFWYYNNTDFYTLFIGHNIVMFDRPVLEKVWEIKLPIQNCYDTLLVSRLTSPDRQSHKLEAWGNDLGCPKLEHKDFDRYSDEMRIYCENDTLVTQKLFEYQKQFRTPEWAYSTQIEHTVANIIQEQIANGFLLDRKYASEFLNNLYLDLDNIEEDLQNTFEPTLVYLKTKVKSIPFNPGSRQQIADRLTKRGWVPKVFSPTGKPVVDEATLSSCTLPEARKLEQYLLIQKRISQVESWLEKANKTSDRVHGNVITNGAVTGRMTHSEPNMAQIPNLSSPYGKECRSCWIAAPGKVLVDIDASGLELRMLAHYMQDPKYTEAVIHGKKEDGTDIHTINMKAAGLTSRDTAKTFIYAFLYGAGDAKIGKIVGGNATDGRKLKERFLQQVPALATLKRKVAIYARNGYLPGLDGRQIPVRSEHAALNTLLQGGGAVVMKLALINFVHSIPQTPNFADVKIVANVHDEWVIECPQNVAEHIGYLGVLAIKKAGEDLKLRCPLDGSYSIGPNWSIH